jgi:hypothetical protein
MPIKLKIKPPTTAAGTRLFVVLLFPSSPV